LSDTIPPNSDFVSASISNNPDGTFTGPVVSEGDITIKATSLASQSGVILLVTVSPTAAGTLNNVTTVTSSTPDENGGTYHSAGWTNMAPAPGGGAASLSVIPGESIGLNVETGLFQQTVQVNNTGGAAATAVSLAVSGLPPGVTVYNATGTNNGAPYIVYNYPVPAGGNVVFLIQYYDNLTHVWPGALPTFTATVIAAAVVPTPTGTYVPVDPGWPQFTTTTPLGPLLTIEFASIPGHTYVVEYSSDLVTWQVATPPIIATGTTTLWIDDGPPSTETPPGGAGQRMYRIVQTN
jgi:hypothetical protein